jgi:nucleoside-diphosphate-sugar epimerase
MRVVITGAAGTIGSELVEEFHASHELRLLDRHTTMKGPSEVTNLDQNRLTSYWKPWSRSRKPSWMTMFKGADVVVHLAAYLHQDLNWPHVLQDNIQVTWNVLEAAVEHRVPRVVFASSNWVVKGTELALAPACYEPQGPKIGSDAAPCPKTLYGISKAFGETTGRTLVEEGHIRSFVAVRIGSYHPIAPKKEETRRRWIGSKDIRSLFRRCVEEEFSGFHVVYGVSAQRTAPYDLSYTSHLLSWKPEQLAEDPSLGLTNLQCQKC